MFVMMKPTLKHVLLMGVIAALTMLTLISVRFAFATRTSKFMQKCRAPNPRLLETAFVILSMMGQVVILMEEIA